MCLRAIIHKFSLSNILSLSFYFCFPIQTSRLNKKDKDSQKNISRYYLQIFLDIIHGIKMIFGFYDVMAFIL